MVLFKPKHRIRAALLTVAAIGIATVAAATTVKFVPLMASPGTVSRVESPLPTLTVGGAIDLKQAFGKDDEDCVYAGPADGAKTLICRQ